MSLGAVAAASEGQAATSFQSAELIDLFEAYTASPRSIGAHFAQAAAQASAHDPLIVATGTDIAVYPGDGELPTVHGFRVSTRGFKELAAVSHLGPALATLVRMKELDDRGPWRSDAQRLLSVTAAARTANTVGLWRDQIAVAAFAGREPAIAAMVDYSCAVTERMLERALSEPWWFTAASLRRDYLEGPSADLPVPFNRVMVATFFLTGMDIAHRLITWFDGLDLPWERAMVVVAGRQGRPTSGVTRETNSVAGVIQAAARGRLPAGRLLIAPHAPVFPMYDGTSLQQVADLEQGFRQLWAHTIATSELGALMFDGYAAFESAARRGAVATPGTPSVSEMPSVASPQDWFALTTRLRVVLEDPRQLLSGAVTDYASQQLVDHSNEPSAVTVPGLDGEPYPALPGPAAAVAVTDHPIPSDPGDRHD